MRIHIIRNRPTPEQIHEMSEELETYIKLAVDVERDILAGGGEYHADCEELVGFFCKRKEKRGCLTNLQKREEV